MGDEGRTKDWGPYIRCLADKMGLRDWTVGHDAREPEADCNATAECIYGRKFLWIRLSEAFDRRKPEDQRQTICHELIHAHFAAAERFLCEELGERPFATFRLLAEYGVDGLAEVLAPHLPLPGQVRPSKPKPKGKPMGRQRPAKTPVAEPKPKAAPKPAPKDKGKGNGK